MTHETRPTSDDHLNIIFWGTSEFAIPLLETLISHGYSVVAVVTNPDEPVGRRQVLTPPPVKTFAQSYRVPVLQPRELKNNPIIYKEIQEFNPDIFIVAAYGKIILKNILGIPKLGALNVHPSLLPRWRGPSPIQYTILEGDTKTGVTIIKMDELMDHGPILAKRELEFQKFAPSANPRASPVGRKDICVRLNFQFSKINYKILHDELAQLGAKLLSETLPRWINGKIKPVEQNEAEATYSKILKKEDGRISWSWPAEKIERMVRAFNPWPGAWTLWPSSEKIYRVKIEVAYEAEVESIAAQNGHLWQTKGYPLLVKTGHGSLAAQKLTMEGHKSLDAEAFLKGHNIIGTNFV